MSRLVVELTNRCNLRCGHCYDERHAATGDLPLSILDKVLFEGRDHGIDNLSFTGGEPTIHRDFGEVIRRTVAAGYAFSFVSNGVRLPRIHPLLTEHRERFQGVTFSLDGAREATHDALRGHGSYRQVMRAASTCVYKDLPFTLNMVLTARNRGEVVEMVELAERLGSGGIRFGHLMTTASTATRGLDLSLTERREVEREIWRLRDTAAINVTMAPGYYSEELIACLPLLAEEFNLDYRGNLTLCCHVSGYEGGAAQAAVVASLHEMSLTEAVACFRRRVASYLDDKRARVAAGVFGEEDRFHCLYCVHYLEEGRRTLSLPSRPRAAMSGEATR